MPLLADLPGMASNSAVRIETSKTNSRFLFENSLKDGLPGLKLTLRKVTAYSAQPSVSWSGPGVKHWLAHTHFVLRSVCWVQLEPQHD
ncbi:hypothetical protein soil367_09615 [Hydrocarboniclastica marina]|uniref:Uncharacterized protein n=1 Tax=Hydrocarboniclastica marina TaxID=2259620 RepID=A0A4P7XGQ6_9ALTE|nr:hypothetical protein soil367_09615 [Hydrocarboniclastica marina]